MATFTAGFLKFTILEKIVSKPTITPIELMPDGLPQGVFTDQDYKDIGWSLLGAAAFIIGLLFVMKLDN